MKVVGNTIVICTSRSLGRTTICWGTGTGTRRPGGSFSSERMAGMGIIVLYLGLLLRSRSHQWSCQCICACIWSTYNTHMDWYMCMYVKHIQLTYARTYVRDIRQSISHMHGLYWIHTKIYLHVSVCICFHLEAISSAYLPACCLHTGTYIHIWIDISVFWSAYLHVSDCILTVFLAHTYTYGLHMHCMYLTVSECISVCIWDRFLRRFLRRLFLRRFLRAAVRSCIAVCAVTSPSHCRIVSAAHRIAARNAGELPTLLELHMPVVQPTRCTRTEEVEPQQQWALGEVMMRTYVEVMVERLWLDDPAKVSDAPSDEVHRSWSSAQHNPRKNSKNQTMICIIMYNTLAIKLNKGSVVIQ